MIALAAVLVTLASLFSIATAVLLVRLVGATGADSSTGGAFTVLDVPAVLAELLVGPRLDGALCRGRSPEWDADVAGESPLERHRRIGAAVTTCSMCPALASCSALLPELPRTTSGVWAGQVLRRSS